MCSSAAMSPLNSSEVYRQLYDVLWSTIFIHPGTYPSLTSLSPHSFAHSTFYILMYGCRSNSDRLSYMSEDQFGRNKGDCSSGAMSHSSNGVSRIYPASCCV